MPNFPVCNVDNYATASRYRDVLKARTSTLCSSNMCLPGSNKELKTWYCTQMPLLKDIRILLLAIMLLSHPASMSDSDVQTPTPGQREIFCLKKILTSLKSYLYQMCATFSKRWSCLQTLTQLNDLLFHIALKIFLLEMTLAIEDHRTMKLKPIVLSSISGFVLWAIRFDKTNRTIGKAQKSRRGSMIWKKNFVP